MVNSFINLKVIDFMRKSCSILLLDSKEMIIFILKLQWAT